MNRVDFLLSLISGGLQLSALRKKQAFLEKFANPVGAFCNYSQSFVTHITEKKANQARINIEARTIIENSSNGSVKDYFKFASCKSENTYATKDLFMDPNYDFSGVYNAEEFVIFRSRQYYEGYAERGQVRNRFASIRVQLLEEKRISRLDTQNGIVDATLRGKNLIGRTTFKRNKSERVILEYPIKTINVNDIEFIYQVDTGPVAVPHPKKTDLPVLDSLELAFLAFNRSDIAYFVFNSATPIQGLTGISNNHYSEIIEVPDVVNEIYQID
ncbi:MAG TPA: hypothetical protein VGD65_19335 [Chryseosolibacter sp.]